jgi:hypothetical protein
MRSSKVLSNNPYVSDKNLAEKYTIANKYNELYLDTVDLYTGKLSISEATTTVLTSSDHGKVFFVDAATVAAIYTLPAPIIGLTFKWIWVADCNNAITIKTADITDTTGDMLAGALIVWSSTAATNLTVRETVANCNTLILDDNAVNSGAGIGTWVEITCVEDAVWHVCGVINGSSTGSALFSNAD